MKVIIAILGVVVSFAATLMAWWKHKRYLQMTYALYLAVLVVICSPILISRGSGWLRGFVRKNVAFLF